MAVDAVLKKRRGQWHDQRAHVSRRSRTSKRQVSHCRRGAATLDYVLVMGVIFPLATFLFFICPMLMNLVYEFTVIVISWPFK